MFGAIARRLLTGGALLLTAFLAADAADIDDDLPDLTGQIAQMASEVAHELQRPPDAPSAADAQTGPRGRRDCPDSESGA
jgi:hypothetical protein